MMNKKIIIGAVALVLLGGGFYFWSGEHGSVSLPINKKGELTRELARQIILDYYNKEMKDNSNTTTFTYFEPCKGYVYGYTTSKDQIQQLVNKGLINKVNQDCFDDFTDAAAPYLSNGTTPKSKVVKLGERKLKDLTITGIVQVSETVSYAEINITGENTNTPFGEVLNSENKAEKTESGKIPLVLYDDGWRVSLTGQ